MKIWKNNKPSFGDIRVLVESVICVQLPILLLNEGFSGDFFLDLDACKRESSALTQGI